MTVEQELIDLLRDHESAVNTGLRVIPMPPEGRLSFIKCLRCYYADIYDCYYVRSEGCKRCREAGVE